MALRRVLCTLVLGLALPACAPAARPTVVRSAPPLLGRWHRVLAGDTVTLIAERFGTPLADIEELNGVDRRDALVVGRLLFIRRARAGEVAAPSSRPATHRSEAAPRPRGGDVASAHGKQLQWPVPGGRLTSAFGRRGKRVHEGIDIGARAGTPVVAAAPGKVLYAGNGLKGYGNLVILRHEGGLVTVYAHNKRNLVRDGQDVRLGEVLAELGNTGRSTGYHVHFEVRRGDKPVDPLRFLAPPAWR